MKLARWGPCPPAPTQLLVPKIQEGSKRGAGGKMEKLRKPLVQAGETELRAFNSPQQVALGNGLRDSSRDPKFATWLWTLIIIKRQTGNFQTMSC